jgi:hypothetical protein
MLQNVVVNEVRGRCDWWWLGDGKGWLGVMGDEEGVDL